MWEFVIKYYEAYNFIVQYCYSVRQKCTFYLSVELFLSYVLHFMPEYIPLVRALHLSFDRDLVLSGPTLAV